MSVEPAGGNDDTLFSPPRSGTKTVESKIDTREEPTSPLPEFLADHLVHVKLEAEEKIHSLKHENKVLRLALGNVEAKTDENRIIKQKLHVRESISTDPARKSLDFSLVDDYFKEEQQEEEGNPGFEIDTDEDPIAITWNLGNQEFSRGKFQEGVKHYTIAAKMLVSNLAAAEEKASRMNEELEEINQAKLNVENTLEKTEEEYKSRINELQSELGTQDEFKRELAEAKSVLQQKEAKIDELEQSLNDLKSENFRLAELESQNLELLQKLEEIETDFRMLEAKNEERLEELAVKEAEADKNSEMVQSLQQEKANLQDSLIVLKRDLGAGEKQIESLKSKVVELTEMMKSKEEELNNAEILVEELRNSRDKVVEAVGNLEVDLEKESAKCVAKTEELNSFKLHTVKVEAELLESFVQLDELTRLKQDLAVLQQANEQLKTKLEESESQFEAAVERNRENQRDLATKTREIEELNSLIQTSDTQKQENDVLITKLMEEVEEKAKINDEHEAQIAELKGQMEGSSLRFRDEIKAKEELSSILNDKLEESLSEIEELRSKAGILEEEKQSLEDEMNVLKSETIQMMSEDLSAATAKIYTLQAELKSSREKLDERTDKFKKLAKKYKALREAQSGPEKKQREELLESEKDLKFIVEEQAAKIEELQKILSEQGKVERQVTDNINSERVDSYRQSDTNANPVEFQSTPMSAKVDPIENDGVSGPFSLFGSGFSSKEGSGANVDTEKATANQDDNGTNEAINDNDSLSVQASSVANVQEFASTEQWQPGIEENHGQTEPTTSISIDEQAERGSSQDTHKDSYVHDDSESTIQKVHNRYLTDESFAYDHSIGNLPEADVEGKGLETSKQQVNEDAMVNETDSMSVQASSVANIQDFANQDQAEGDVKNADDVVSNSFLSEKAEDFHNAQRLIRVLTEEDKCQREIREGDTEAALSIEELQQLLQDERHRNENLSQDFQSVQEKSTRLEQEVSRLKSEIESLSLSIEEEMQSRLRLEVERDALLNTENMDLSKELESTEIQVEQQMTAIDRYKLTVKKLREEISRLRNSSVTNGTQAQDQIMRESAISAAETIWHEKTEKQDDGKQVTSSELELNLNEEINKLRKEKKGLENEVRHSRDYALELEGDIEKNGSCIVELETEISGLRLQLEAKETELKRYKDEMDSVKSENRNLEDRNQAQIEDIAVKESELMKQQRETEYLSQQFEELQELIIKEKEGKKKLQIDLEETKLKHERLKNDYDEISQKNVDDLIQEIETIKSREISRVAELEEQILYLKSQIDSLEQERLGFKKELSLVRNTKEDLKSREEALLKLTSKWNKLLGLLKRMEIERDHALDEAAAMYKFDLSDEFEHEMSKSTKRDRKQRSNLKKELMQVEQDIGEIPRGEPTEGWIAYVDGLSKFVDDFEFAEKNVSYNSKVEDEQVIKMGEAEIHNILQLINYCAEEIGECHKYLTSLPPLHEYGSSHLNLLQADLTECTELVSKCLDSHGTNKELQKVHLMNGKYDDSSLTNLAADLEECLNFVKRFEEQIEGGLAFEQKTTDEDTSKILIERDQALLELKKLRCQLESRKMLFGHKAPSTPRASVGSREKQVSNRNTSETPSRSLKISARVDKGLFKSPDSLIYSIPDTNKKTWVSKTSTPEEVIESNSQVLTPWSNPDFKPSRLKLENISDTGTGLEHSQDQRKEAPLLSNSTQMVAKSEEDGPASKSHLIREKSFTDSTLPTTISESIEDSNQFMTNKRRSNSGRSFVSQMFGIGSKIEAEAKLGDKNSDFASDDEDPEEKPKPVKNAMSDPFTAARTAENRRRSSTGHSHQQHSPMSSPRQVAASWTTTSPKPAGRQMQGKMSEQEQAQSSSANDGTSPDWRDVHSQTNMDLPESAVYQQYAKAPDEHGNISSSWNLESEQSVNRNESSCAPEGPMASVNLQEELMRLKVERDALKDEVKRLRSALSVEKETRLWRENQQCVLEEDMEQLLVANEDLNHTIASLENEINILKDESSREAAAGGTIDERVHTVSKAESQITELEEKLRISNEEIQNLKRVLKAAENHATYDTKAEPQGMQQAEDMDDSASGDQTDKKLQEYQQQLLTRDKDIEKLVMQLSNKFYTGHDRKIVKLAPKRFKHHRSHNGFIYSTWTYLMPNLLVVLTAFITAIGSPQYIDSVEAPRIPS